MKISTMMLAVALSAVMAMSVTTTADAHGWHGGGRGFHGGGVRFYAAPVYVGPTCWVWRRGYRYWVC